MGSGRIFEDNLQASADVAWQKICQKDVGMEILNRLLNARMIITQYGVKNKRLFIKAVANSAD